MLSLSVLATAIVICGLGAAQNPPHPKYAPLGSRIVGGEQVPIEQVPYQLSLEENDQHKCGAVIISADWALSTARCAFGLKIENARLRSGTDTLNEGGSVHTVSEMIVNEQYDYFRADYDIALFRVSEAFVFGVSTAAIALADTEPPPGTACFVSGWGATALDNETLPMELQGVEVPIVERKACEETYLNYGGITDRMICAGFTDGGKDPCLGDAGGPLQSGGKLVGIVGWGVCGEYPGFPAVYTNVAVLKDWVIENTGI